MSIPVEVINVIKDNKKFFVMAGAELVAVGGAAGGYIIRKIDNKRIIKEKKISFEDGVRKGSQMAVDKMKQTFIDPLLARVAVSYYIARIDGNISAEELEILDMRLNDILNNPDIPAAIKKEAKTLANNKKIDYQMVISYLEKLNDMTLATVMVDVYKIAKASEGINEKEQEVISKLEEYISYRLPGNYVVIDNVSSENMDMYLNGFITEEEIVNVVNKYDLKMRMLDRKFSKLTQLNYKEIGLLMVATSMQIMRIYLMNYLTAIEKVGNKNMKENFLHKQQSKILSHFKAESEDVSKDYYASLSQIVTGRGVPYDATRYQTENLKLFKGANHRFSTLGHEPIVGLLVGTTNIMTNTITTINDSSLIPQTHHVVYDSMLKNPMIGNEASLVAALKNVLDRSKKDLTPLVAAFIKQLIHITTDLYTPAGIQLPGANLVLNRKNVELLTSYVSSGDLVKIGTSANIEVLINKLIEILHGCLLLENEENIINKMNQAKTKKIIMYSNTIATTSNVLKTTYTGNLHDLDWAGLINMIKRMLNDGDFMYELKWQFINDGLKNL